MRHNSIPSSTMPMRLASGNMHNITNLQPSGLLPFRTDKTSSHGHSQDLASLVCVPEGPRSRGEADIVAHAVVRFEDGIHVHIAGESFCGLLRGSVRLVGAADELHFG